MNETPAVEATVETAQAASKRSLLRNPLLVKSAVAAVGVVAAFFVVKTVTTKLQNQTDDVLEDVNPSN